MRELLSPTAYVVFTIVLPRFGAIVVYGCIVVLGLRRWRWGTPGAIPVTLAIGYWMLEQIFHLVIFVLQWGQYAEISDIVESPLFQVWNWTAPILSPVSAPLLCWGLLRAWRAAESAGPVDSPNAGSVP